MWWEDLYWLQLSLKQSATPHAPCAAIAGSPVDDSDFKITTIWEAPYAAAIMFLKALMSVTSSSGTVPVVSILLSAIAADVYWVEVTQPVWTRQLLSELMKNDPFPILIGLYVNFSPPVVCPGLVKYVTLKAEAGATAGNWVNKLGAAGLAVYDCTLSICVTSLPEAVKRYDMQDVPGLKHKSKVTQLTGFVSPAIGCATDAARTRVPVPVVKTWSGVANAWKHTSSAVCKLHGMFGQLSQQRL
jgi:hypothetical protein